MADYLRMREIVGDIRYRDWEFRVTMDRHLPFLQIIFPDPITGEEQRCRRWVLSSYMEEGEIVRTVLLAVLNAEEHEARERLTYRGRKVFNPHLSLEEMYDRALQTEQPAAPGAPESASAGASQASASGGD